MYLLSLKLFVHGQFDIKWKNENNLKASFFIIYFEIEERIVLNKSCENQREGVLS
jgi:hypothetical protein